MRTPILALSMALVSVSPSFAGTPAVPAPALETICPVTGKAIPEGQGILVSVRGRDHRVIDADAAFELKANPDKYLGPDGTPRNRSVKDGAVPAQ